MPNILQWKILAEFQLTIFEEKLSWWSRDLIAVKPADIPYIGPLSRADTFLSNKTSMLRTHYRVHLSISGIIFRCQFTLPPRTDLSIADTTNSRLYETFLGRNLYTFCFRQCFTVSFKFSMIFVILFFSQFNGLFRSIKMKIQRDFSPYSPPWLTFFPVAKMIKAQWGRDSNTNAIMEISVAYGQPPLLYSEN